MVQNKLDNTKKLSRKVKSKKNQKKKPTEQLKDLCVRAYSKVKVGPGGGQRAGGCVVAAYRRVGEGLPGFATFRCRLSLCCSLFHQPAGSTFFAGCGFG